MGKISVVFLTALTCIFLISQIPQTESTSNNNATEANENRQRNIQIELNATEDNYVTFNFSHVDPAKDQYKYKLYTLACKSSPGESQWVDIEKNKLAKRIVAPPYTNVTFEIQDKTNRNIIARNSTVTPAKEPEARVTDLHCDRKTCNATVESDCRKYNGDNVTVQFTLRPSSEKHKNPLVMAVNPERHVMIGLKDLDLLPFTNYTVTANLANSVGPATNASLIGEIIFITKPKKPGRVSSLAVTQSTPSSFHVVWTAPDDHPPKGKLSQYRLEWRSLGGNTNAGSRIVNKSVTSFIITGLAPTTTYEITVSAKNADTYRFGQGVSVTNTTKREGATDPKTGAADSNTNTTIHFSWYESASGSGKPADYYRVTYSHGDERAENTTTSNTDITLTGLTPGKKYTLVVQACSAAGHCDQLTTLKNWTRPAQPRVVEKTELQKTTDTTLTVQLPVLQNPPGWLWVLLKKYSGVRDEGAAEEVVAMVRMEGEKERKNEEKSKETQAKTRKRRSADPDQNDDKLRIAAKVEVVEGQEPEKIVVVGGDWNGGDGLEGDTDYVVFIVTETKAGPYSEYRPSKPRVMRTAKRPKEPALLGMISGLCGAALFLICFFTMMVMKRKKK